MKVLIATGLYPPDIGGPATYAKLLYDVLPDYGIESSVLSFGEVRHLPRVVRHIVYFFKIFYRRKEIDTIFAQDPASAGFPALVAAKLLRKRFFLKVVGDYAWEQYMQGKSGRKAPVTPEEFQQRRFGIFTEIQRDVEHFVARNAEKVIVPSEYLKRIVLLWGVNERRVRVVYNGFKAPRIEESKEELRQALGFKGTIITSAGRLVPWKGFRTLIEITPELLKHFPDSTLIIIGDGPEKAGLERLVAEKELSDKVILLGRLEHALTLSYLKASDLFVLNTAYEGFSHLLLEVMALGTPLITTAVGGNPELVKEGVDGTLVPFDDADALQRSVITVLKNRERAAARAENAKRTVEKFSDEKMFDELIRVLSE